MYTSYQYGGRSDDLEYMQEVLKTAERLGDQAYIARIKAQIEEIKRIQSGKKEDSRRRKGQVCKPGLPTMDPMSCRGDFMSKCTKDPEDNVFKCCSTTNGKLDCKEIVAKVDSGLIKPSSIKIIPDTIAKGTLTQKPLTTSPSKISPTSSTLDTISTTSTISLPAPPQGTPIQTPQQSQPQSPQPQPQQKDLSNEDKKAITEYYELKSSILKTIEELKVLKVKKDSLVQFTGKTPSLVYHTQQNNMDDCIRDETGKVLKC
jgi:hypothetical protein